MIALAMARHNVELWKMVQDVRMGLKTMAQGVPRTLKKMALDDHVTWK